MLDSNVFSAMTLVMMVMTVTFLMYTFLQQMKERTRQREKEREQRDKEREQLDIVRQTRHQIIELEQKIDLSRKDAAKAAKRSIELQTAMDEKSEEKKEDHNSGGYIIVDMPESKRSLFHDLLKGFEEYGKLKGYLVYFSIDSSMPNKIAFKFTLGESGISVSSSQVRNDLKEYLDRIASGQPLEDMPTIISPLEHGLVLTTLKNRINFLQSNQNILKNTVGYYEKIIECITSNKHGINPSTNFYLQSGGSMDSRKYIASNSSDVNQGDNNSLTDSSIKIAGSFNDRKEQVEVIQRLIDALKTDKKVGDNEKDEIVLNLEKVKDELTEEASPDKGRIARWLGKAKSCLGGLKLAKKTLVFVKEVYDNFNL
jgi:hypothetical protein